MNLGYGLAALDSYYKEGDARQLRERADQRFDWERQKAQSELSLLDDKAAADRSGYQNTVAENASRTELRPLETANKKTQLGIDSVSLAGAAKRQPTLEEAKDSEAVAAAGAAKVKAALEGVEVERIPSVVADAKMKGIITDATSSNLVSATIADMIDSGNQAGLVKLLNAQKQYAGDPKVAALPDVANVAKARDANGQEVLVLKDAAGNTIMSRPVSIYQAARDSLKKQEVKEVKEGHSLVSVRGNTVTPLYTAPESASSRATKMGPLERDVNYLVSGHGMSKEQALAHLQSAKTMSRENFILKAVENAQAMGKKVTDADMIEFGAIYDRASKSTQKPAGGGANKAVPTDPTVRKYLGL